MTPLHTRLSSRLWGLAILFLSLSGFATSSADLQALDAALERKASFEAVKQARIDSLLACLSDSPDTYALYAALFDEYKSYNYDTALIYVNKMYDEALLLQDGRKRLHAELSRGFALLSAGLFKESADVFEDIAPYHHQMDSATRIQYDITYARLLFDMADYAGGPQSAKYNSDGIRHMEDAISIISPLDTVTYWYCMATIDLHLGEYQRSIQRFTTSMLGSKCTTHERAIGLSSIAYQKLALGYYDEAQHYNILAAIADIESCTKEAVALRIVAKVLYDEGQTDLAERYIRIALDDAQRYNARHRQLEISQILPIIEDHQVLAERRQNVRIRLLSGVVVVLLLICLVTLLLLRRRQRALLSARRTIEQINDSLLVANKVKEEILGSLLCSQSEYLSEVERYQQQVKRYAQSRQYDGLLTVPKLVDAKRQRNLFYNRLDEMLLSVFPSFVDDFNALLRPDERMLLKQGELLNTELRIFALMRLGIIHNEVIAQVLDYSVNTIYTYKTRVKNRSDLSSDAFHAAVMAIPSFRSTPKQP